MKSVNKPILVFFIVLMGLMLIIFFRDNPISQALASPESTIIYVTVFIGFFAFIGGTIYLEFHMAQMNTRLIRDIAQKLSLNVKEQTGTLLGKQIEAKGTYKEKNIVVHSHIHSLYRLIGPRHGLGLRRIRIYVSTHHTIPERFCMFRGFNEVSFKKDSKYFRKLAHEEEIKEKMGKVAMQPGEIFSFYRDYAMLLTNFKDADSIIASIDKLIEYSNKLQ